MLYLNITETGKIAKLRYSANALARGYAFLQCTVSLFIVTVRSAYIACELLKLLHK